jgi:hypothetical protein
MIEIFNYRKIDKGAVLASFSIRLKKWNDFCIHGITHFGKDNTAWISFPSNKVEKEGETKYYPYCGFSDKDLNASFKGEILRALNAYEHKNHKQEDLPF